VSNQAVGPGNTGDIFYFMRVLLFILLLSMGYALSRPRPVGEKEQATLLPDTETLPQYQQWPRLLPWQRKASEKAIERYAGSQEKKWRRWNEAMFERPA
jgi:hypothetical protein